MSKRKLPELRTERIVLPPTDPEAIRAETEASVAPERDTTNYAALFVTGGAYLAGGVAIAEAVKKRTAARKAAARTSTTLGDLKGYDLKVITVTSGGAPEGYRDVAEEIPFTFEVDIDNKTLWIILDDQSDTRP